MKSNPTSGYIGSAMDFVTPETYLGNFTLDNNYGVYVDGDKVYGGEGSFWLSNSTGVASIQYFDLWNGNGPRAKGVSVTQGAVMDYLNGDKNNSLIWSGQGVYVQLQLGNKGKLVNPLTASTSTVNPLNMFGSHLEYVAIGGFGFPIWNTAANIIAKITDPKADLTLGGAEYNLGKILTDRAKYSFTKAPWETKALRSITTIRTPFVNLNVSTKFLQSTGIALKWGGRAFGALGLVGTYAQWQTGAISNKEAALDATFGAIGFWPGYGWAVSGAYFLIAKPIYKYATKP